MMDPGIYRYRPAPESAGDMLRALAAQDVRRIHSTGRGQQPNKPTMSAAAIGKKRRKLKQAKRARKLNRGK